MWNKQDSTQLLVKVARALQASPWLRRGAEAALHSQPWKPAQDVPAGVYFYVLKLPGGMERTGSVAVVR